MAAVVAALPFGRRYARALTGSQASGDAIVADALRQGLPPLPGSLGLFAAITRLTPTDALDTTPGALSTAGRQLLLLTALEGLSVLDAAQVVGLDPAEAVAVLEAARAALRTITATDVLIIEDEPVIAMDLRMLVESCGHRVTGIAATEAQAVRLAAAHPTGLILADVNLGRGGDGINAVRRILQSVQVPVIFVTAYPERLLTAGEVEPAFIMSKPFDPIALAISTYQAVTAGRVPIA
ncbi:response regulator [Humitalea sp. 24SJ18S-53]|uniref:response regulator n=1 Tax=Humitalea sp. 24SJ18S-53 TaxID=3422307 RepID=UPI003D67A935